jgi:IS5 family transposase
MPAQQGRRDQAGRYAHAKQFRRMRRAIRKLRTYLGRVIRDMQR